MDNNQTRFWFVVALVLAAAASRLIPHPPNFTPVVALALFAGAQLTSRWLAIAVPLLALMLGDIILGLHSTLPAVYLAMILAVFIGARSCRSGRAAPVALSAIGSAAMFFLISNFAVWLVGGLYPPTAAGLSACFLAAIPFFQNTLVSTMLYAAALFGGLRLAESMLPLLRTPITAVPRG